MGNRNIVLSAHAHRMRSAPTDSEELLWRALRARQLGVRFRKQVPLLGRFVVDFLAPSTRLVVEVDGAYHARVRSADASRERKPVRAGYRVLRLQAELVLRELPAAVALVRAALVEPPR